MNLRSMASFWLTLCCFGLAPLMAQSKEELHTTPQNVPVLKLDAKAAFESLTKQEKLYAHWMSEASWWGALITFEQLSAESPRLLELFQRLYRHHPVALRQAAQHAGVTDTELADLETYAARVYSNCGNYLSFGDTKFIPRLSAAAFAKVINAVATMNSIRDERLITLWNDLKVPIYSLADDVLALGLEDEGVSAYYSKNITKADLSLAAEFMKSIGMEAWNSRLFKDEDGTLHIKVASALAQPSSQQEFKGCKIAIDYGDFSTILKRVVRSLERALPHAANDKQRRMILAYIDHFNGGDIADHKESQAYWVKDIGPVVETNIGFIETYRDPSAVRAEWEGLVAVVNKEQTKKFAALVERAPSLIPLLPWGKSFEKDLFRRPDFTSLEVLAFANSGIPLGINIPNYDDIRQNIGFKNVSLGNVTRARGKGDGKISFLKEEDQELYRLWADPSFEVQVGLHELLGHGSGKLLEERSDGTFNFAPETVVNPLTKEKISSWYRPGETWGSQFTTIASSYEECRAEAVGLHLCTNEDVLRVFGHEGQEGEDVAYVNWLAMARAGLSALTFYDPAKKRWGQAHMQGRFALLQVMLRAGGGLVAVRQDASGDWLVHLDRSKIKKVGAKAVADFLTLLNVYKATADSAAGRKLYLDHTSVDQKFLKIRSYVLANRKPRHSWVQPVTDVDAQGNVLYRDFPATSRGVIDSFQDRYAGLYD